MQSAKKHHPKATSFSQPSGLVRPILAVSGLHFNFQKKPQASPSLRSVEVTRPRGGTGAKNKGGFAPLIHGNPLSLRPEGGIYSNYMLLFVFWPDDGNYPPVTNYLITQFPNSPITQLPDYPIPQLPNYPITQLPNYPIT